MSDFFESEIVKEAMEEITELQYQVYNDTLRFQAMSKEQKKEHIERFTELLDKQHIFYNRMALSEDPDAILMKEQIKQMALYFGLGENHDVNEMFHQMKEAIQSLAEKVDTQF